MKNIKKQGGFSLILALGIVMVLSTLSLLLLEYIIPFSKSVKGLDNYTKAYYQSWKGIEETLYFLSNSPLGASASKSFGTSPTDFAYTMIASGSLLPQPGKGESDFDSDWGIISPNKPLHIYLPSGVVWANTRIYLRIPNFDFDTNSNEELDTSLSSQEMVNWQMSSGVDVLNSVPSAGSRFIGSDICSSLGTCPGKTLQTVLGKKLDGTSQNFGDFFSNNCASDFNCTIKLSLVNQLSAQSFGIGGKKIPYLEYRVDFAGVGVPYDKILLQSSGKSYGFKKDFSFVFPLKLLNEAFDFTIFQ